MPLLIVNLRCGKPLALSPSGYGVTCLKCPWGLGDVTNFLGTLASAVAEALFNGRCSQHSPAQACASNICSKKFHVLGAPLSIVWDDPFPELEAGVKTQACPEIIRVTLDFWIRHLLVSFLDVCFELWIMTSHNDELCWGLLGIVIQDSPPSKTLSLWHLLCPRNPSKQPLDLTFWAWWLQGA